MASCLIVKNASLATTYPDVFTAYMMYMTVPVTVATAERSFSKLKLIKNFLRSSMSQERLSGLALLSIENEQAKNLDFRKVIQHFADAKVRRKNFKFPTIRKKITVAYLIGLNVLCFISLCLCDDVSVLYVNSFWVKQFICIAQHISILLKYR